MHGCDRAGAVDHGDQNRPANTQTVRYPSYDIEVSSQGTADVSSGTLPSAAVDPGLAPERGRRDQQSVTADAEPVAEGIDGVLIRPAVTLPDERGELTVILSDQWPESLGASIPHVYMTTIVPGVVKGWICHKLQADRSMILFGRLRWVLYDGRPGSPTVGLVQVRTFTERNRHLVVVPAGVWHAVENVGSSEAAFVNLPTLAYRHEDPDKYRLPLDTSEIPFRFRSRR
jgi:dTDP-4-dehydrorhamnose 3,5-epimerase